MSQYVCQNSNWWNSHAFNDNKVTKGQPINMNPLHTENQGRHEQLLVSKTPSWLRLDAATLTLVMEESVRGAWIGCGCEGGHLHSYVQDSVRMGPGSGAPGRSCPQTSSRSESHCPADSQTPGGSCPLWWSLKGHDPG